MRKMDSSCALESRVRLALADGVGRRLFERLLARFGSLDAVFRASPEALQAIRGIGPLLARRILDPDLAERAKREMEEAERAGWRIDSPGCGQYPPLLLETYDPPLILYRRGELPTDDSLPLAIVGARRSTSYGLRQARRFGEDLARAGCTIVSGLARGVDTAAHRGALRGGGRTIAVLGTGLDLAYPPENASLIDEISHRGGAVLTEFHRGTLPLPGNFPRRNRIISGLCQGIIVIEAAEKSGALITARWAAEENRDVFALPGSVETGRSRGCHRLILDGAQLVETAAQVLDGFIGPTGSDAPGEGVDTGGLGLDREILDLLRDGEMSIDEIGEAADLRPSDLAMRLLRLEISGAVHQYPGRRFALAGGEGSEKVCENSSPWEFSTPHRRGFDING